MIFTRIGILSTLDIFSHTFDTMGLLSHQTMGAMIVMVILGLWTARVHMWHVVQHLWRREGRSDGEELLSYRTFPTLGLAVMSLWPLGLPLWAVFVYRSGRLSFFGSDADDRRSWFGRGRPGHVGLRLSQALAHVPRGGWGAGYGHDPRLGGDLLVFMMAPCANGIRMLHGLSRYKHRILAMIGLAMAIGLVGGVCTILVLSYHYGANNYHGSWAWFAKEPFRVAQNFALNSGLGWLVERTARRLWRC